MSGPPKIRPRATARIHEGDCHPGDNSIFVNAKDHLSLSLLQARLIELGKPIKIVEGI
jgi:hypothetical protein